MALHSSLSVILPALNEEENLQDAVSSVLSVAPRFFATTELILINDGSTDGTGRIVESIASSHPGTLALHHASPQNLGACYREGVHLATGDFIIMIPGDNECSVDVMEKVFSLAGKADMILPYTENSEERGWIRHQLSQTFVTLLNAISGRKLRYYNGAVLHRAPLVKSVSITTAGFGYQAEVLVKLLRQGASYCEVGTRIIPRAKGSSKALHWRNILQTLTFLLALLRQCRT